MYQFIPSIVNACGRLLFPFSSYHALLLVLDNVASMEPGYMGGVGVSEFGINPWPFMNHKCEAFLLPRLLWAAGSIRGMCSMLMPQSKCLQLDKGITSV